MKDPHGKLAGRALSNNPEIGIPLALEILSDSEVHRNDMLSCVCYLGYRILDGTYKDVDFIWPKILIARQEAALIDPVLDAHWFRTRWIVSFNTLYIYFKLLVFKDEFPEDVLIDTAKVEHVQSHPPQFVNIIRVCAMLFTHYHLIGRDNLADVYYDMSRDFFRQAIKRYIVDPARPEAFVYESEEAVSSLITISEVKWSTSGAYPLNEVVKKWETEAIEEGTKLSKGPVRKAMVAIFNRCKDTWNNDVNIKWKDSELYKKVYEEKPTYGRTGAEKFQIFSDFIHANNIKKVWDFGCGQSNLLMGKLSYRITGLYTLGYDPAVKNPSKFLSNTVSYAETDLIVSTDCLEHLWEDELDKCFEIFKRKNPKHIYLCICTRLAGQILSDGTNAHKTVRLGPWWKERLESSFSPSYKIALYDFRPEVNHVDILLSKS